MRIMTIWKMVFSVLSKDGIIALDRLFLPAIIAKQFESNLLPGCFVFP